jgi:hypothetical protein
MPSMDEYAASGGYARDSQAQVNLGGSGFYSGGSSSGTGGLSSPASYGGTYTSSTPTVARPGMTDTGKNMNGNVNTVLPVPTVAAALGNSGNMMSILMFGGLFILVMSLFKG